MADDEVLMISHESTSLREAALHEAVTFAGTLMTTVGALSDKVVLNIAENFLGFLSPQQVTTQPVERPVTEPAVPIEESVTPEYIVCLDDGKKLRMLKRHITALAYTPQSYRAHWGLPADYPMTAVNYAAKRSELATAAGLGRRDRGRRAAAE